MMINDIRKSLTVLKDIMDYDHNTQIIKAKDDPHGNLYDSVIAENTRLKKENLFLKHQLLEKDKRLKKMHFMYGINL